MALKTPKKGIFKRNIPTKESYIMKRTVKYKDTVYKAGEEVDFDDKQTEQIFIKNNYI